MRCLFATVVVEAIMEDQKLTGVLVENIAGRQALLAGVCVDCSGNADVLHRAGGRFTVLPPDQRMGVTQVFSVSNVDKAAFLRYTEKKGATYNNWGNDGGEKECETEWKQETQGGEGDLRTPYLEREFQEAETRGVLPKVGARAQTHTHTFLSVSTSLSTTYGLTPLAFRRLPNQPSKGLEHQRQLVDRDGRRRAAQPELGPHEGGRA